MAENERYVIEVLDVALDAIEAMATSERECHSPTSLAQHLQINRSRLFRILKTLERRNYVEYDPQTETYRLGLKFLTVSQNIRDRLNLRREAESLLKKLAIDTGDCAHLIVLSGRHAIVVDRYPGENMLQVAAPIGDALPLYTGAVPKLLLAFLPPAEKERLVDELSITSLTPYTIQDKTFLCQVLDQIIENGYSADDQEYEIGVHAFGAPIFDSTGHVVAGISITTPAVRYNPERRSYLIEKVMDTAREISSRLGFQPRMM
jgi:DNA-binding IclR family transcriptional regulator